jgi:hypothetical protein
VLIETFPPIHAIQHGKLTYSLCLELKLRIELLSIVTSDDVINSLEEESSDLVVSFLDHVFDVGNTAWSHFMGGVHSSRPHVIEDKFSNTLMILAKFVGIPIISNFVNVVHEVRLY